MPIKLAVGVRSAKFLIKRDGQNGTEKALSSRFGPLSSRLASSVPFLPFFCPVLAGSHWRRVPFWVRTGWPKCGIGGVEQARPVSVPFARGGEHGLGPFGLGPARASFFFPHIIRVVFLFLFERELVAKALPPRKPLLCREAPSGSEGCGDPHTSSPRVGKLQRVVAHTC